MKSRGDRLKAEALKKNKVKRMIKNKWSVYDRHLAEDKKFVGKIAHTPHCCSCRCCGNPRRMEKGDAKLTTQELKEKFKNEIH